MRNFQAWLDEALRQVVLSGNGGWVAPYIAESVARARDRAIELTGQQLRDSAKVTPLTSLTAVELQGVCEAVSQQAIRVFTTALLAHQRPAKLARAVAAVIYPIGRTRSRAVAQYMVVRAFSSATLDAFRSAGLTQVGTVAERLKVTPVRLRDAARNTPQARHGPTGRFRPFATAPEPEEQEAIEAGEEAVAELGEVDVLTAGDEDVCPICEDISDSGPYDIDDAEGLIPAHPNCRCAFVPTSDERFAEVS